MDKKTIIVLLLLIASIAIAAFSIIRDESSSDLEREEKLMQNFCFEDADCIQSVFCGCHTLGHIEKEIERYTEKGIALDECVHPQNSYCVCEENICKEVIDHDKREEARKKLTANNSEVEGAPNFLTYIEEDDFDRYLQSAHVVKEMTATLNINLLESEEKINLNLPGELNLVLEKEKVVKCEEDPTVAPHLCRENQYTWWGNIKGYDHGSVFFIVDDNSLIASILPSDIPSDLIKVDTRYTYVVTGSNLKENENRGRVIVQ